MNLKEKALEVLSIIESKGYSAYIVGGFVRDYLLNIESNDIDITTNAPLDLLSSWFDTINNGIDYYSVTINYMNSLFEITHFRHDISYSDHRHPEVSLTNSIDEDLVRRDFTINALCFDKNLKIIDKYNGISDLNNKIIRTIENPFKRFDEDVLRIFRGLYLMSKLGFDFEDTTKNAIVECKTLISTLSNDRIYEYMLKINDGKYLDKTLKFINDYNLLSNNIEFNNWFKLLDNRLNKLSLNIRYFNEYNKYTSVITNDEKKLINSYLEIKNNETLGLYYNQDKIEELKNIFEYENVYDKYINKINSFKLKSDNELAMKKEDIAKEFEGKNKKIAINHIIKSILENRINNTKEEIKKELEVFKSE